MLVSFGMGFLSKHWPFPRKWAFCISRLVQDIKYVFSRRLNRQLGRTGSLWQQFWGRFVRHAREFNDRLTYMHLNPVRRALVDRPKEWRWSSYQNFSLEHSMRAACPLQIDEVLLPDSYHA